LNPPILKSGLRNAEQDDSQPPNPDLITRVAVDSQRAEHHNIKTSNELPRTIERQKSVDYHTLEGIMEAMCLHSNLRSVMSVCLFSQHEALLIPAASTFDNRCHQKILGDKPCH
jgi:hypothetical protein